MNELSTSPKLKRSTTISVCLDPRVHYITTLAARDQQRSLSNLIETVIRKALTDGSFDQEPNYGHDITKPAAPAPMWGEGLWDADPADRLFLLATGRPDLLTEAEAQLWKLLSDSILHGEQKLTLGTFRTAYNNPSVSTMHLASEANNG